MARLACNILNRMTELWDVGFARSQDVNRGVCRSDLL